MMCSGAELNVVHSGTEPVTVHSVPDSLVCLFCLHKFPGVQNTNS